MATLRVYLLSAPLTIPLVCCDINGLRRVSRGGEAMARRQREAGGQRIPWHGEAMGLLLPPGCATGLSLSAREGLSGATPRGQPWTSAVTLPQRRNGLSARRMAVWYTFGKPVLRRHVHCELMRSALLDMPPIMPTTACHQRNYVERYSRCKFITFI